MPKAFFVILKIFIPRPAFNRCQQAGSKKLPNLRQGRCSHNFEAHILMYAPEYQYLEL